MRSALAVLVLSAAPALAQPLTTAFTYQGALDNNGQPATGLFDLQFALYDSSGGMTQVGSTLCANDVAVVNGQFTVQLDFGPQFNGQQRHLEVRVRQDTGLSCATATGFTTLAPRSSLTAAPNAAFALSTSTLNGQPASFYTNAGNLTGTLPSATFAGSYSSTINLSSPFNTFTGIGSGLTNLNAGNIAAGTLPIARGGTGTTASPAAAGQYLRSTGAGAWGVSGLLAADLPALAGDVTGPVGASTVSRLQGRTLNTPTPAANQVLTYNGSQWVAQTPAAPPLYSAGAGLSLAGSVFSVPAGGITSTMLDTDAASLTKVTGGLMAISGPNIGINSAAPETDLHIRSAAPILRIEGDANTVGGAALELVEAVAGNTGARLHYDGLANNLEIGTIVADTPTNAILIPRGTTSVNFAGNIDVAGAITIPTTARSIHLSAAAFSFNEGAVMTLGANGVPRITEGTGTVIVVANLQLPQNATITQFEAFIVGGTAPRTVTASLRRVTLTPTPTNTLMASIVSDGSPPYVITTIASPVVDNNTYAYVVQAEWTNAGLHFMDFYGAKVTYTVTSPTP
jgi:hypothetical protein